MLFGSMKLPKVHADIRRFRMVIALASFQRMRIMGRRNGGIHVLLGSNSG
ncbi:hypothetical protein LMG28614_01882 [Paraburkholderia ultramafica]|uniref:Uncharacterized protein n=1 Tax=Paraburkholderia ultramafica TaxID=1544867 RepID=A0A6S7BB17_9BURK|nr:hypothetical protein LMG28614_01882 [Paraburkholderia ultramafica]